MNVIGRPGSSSARPSATLSTTSATFTTYPMRRARGAGPLRLPRSLLFSIGRVAGASPPLAEGLCWRGRHVPRRHQPESKTGSGILSLTRGGSIRESHCGANGFAVGTRSRAGGVARGSRIAPTSRIVRGRCEGARGKCCSRTRTTPPCPNRNGAKVRHHCIPRPLAPPQVSVRTSPASTVGRTQTSSRIPHRPRRRPCALPRLRWSQACGRRP